MPSTSLSRLFGLSQLQLIHLNYFYSLPIGAFSNIATISAVFCRRQQQGRQWTWLLASVPPANCLYHKSALCLESFTKLLRCRLDCTHNSFIQKCPVLPVRSRRDGPPKERLRQCVRQNAAAVAQIMEFPSASGFLHFFYYYFFLHSLSACHLRRLCRGCRLCCSGVHHAELLRPIARGLPPSSPPTTKSGFNTEQHKERLKKGLEGPTS